MLDVKEQANKVGYAMSGRGLKFKCGEAGEEPVITLGFGGGRFSYEHLLVFVVFDEDGTGAQIFTSPVANVPDERADDVIRLLNDLNKRFRWARFYLDGGSVVASCDIPFDEQCGGSGCVEAVMHLATVVDKAYPEIMRAVWQ